MGKNLDKFLLLMWKNFLLQWRHPIQTVVEVLAPVLFSLLLVVLRSVVTPEPHGALFYIPYPGLLPGSVYFPLIIPWSPINPVLERVMNETVWAINDNYAYNVTEHIGFNNSKDMENYMASAINRYDLYAGVQFDDNLVEETELPRNMSITLRFPGELRSDTSLASLGRLTWRTNLLYPVYQTGGPRTWDSNSGGHPRYHHEGFLYLQQEVSLSVINYHKEKLHQESLNRSAFRIRMQRFPYPKWMEDPLLLALQSFIGLIFMLSFVYTCINTVKIITTEKEKQLKLTLQISNHHCSFSQEIPMFTLCDTYSLFLSTNSKNPLNLASITPSNVNFNSNRLLESMKIMGLPNWLHWTAWFLKSFIFLLITITIMVVLLKAKWYPDIEYTVFTNSDPFVIFLFLVLFICATITFCFAISVFFSKANTAATVAGITWFLSYFPHTLMTSQYDTLSLAQKLVTCLFSNTAMAYGFQLILMFEGTEEGLQWHNIWNTVTPDDNLVFGHIIIMLVVDTFLYLLIALYVEAVFPGDYGVPQVWYFPFTSAYWCGKQQHMDYRETNEASNENEFFEKDPTDLHVGIKIKNLRKEWANKKVAVENLSLDIYQDQITVLLGHNGAGKTTTMSMLTGMFPPSSGTALVGGFDIRKNIAEVRGNLGLCPQHNILYDELTVREHLYFYSRLKGLGKRAIQDEIKKYIELLELVPKEHSKASTLSGGMKRKLSVVVALCGDSSIVMCDEPTAGMDPSARRALWNLLQSQKKGRTILLTTHFMDEADLLGDRIAIMAEGKLQCCGSSYFLKKQYGAGYHLVLDKSPQCDVGEVTKLIQKYIPQTQVESNAGSELRYILPEDQSPLFEEMLGDLERNSSSLKILSYGISLTTLEEIYMKVGVSSGQQELNETKTDIEETSKTINISDEEIKNTYSAFSSYTSTTQLHVKEGPLSGWALWSNQFLAMLMKRGLSVLRSWILFVIQNCIPVLFLVLAIVIVRTTDTYRDLPNLKIEIDSYNSPVTVVTRHQSNHTYGYSEKYIDILKKRKMDVIDWKNESMDKNMLKETKDNTAKVLQRYIIGASFTEEDSIIAWYNNNPYHSPPLALQHVLNAILQTETSQEYNMDIYNHPIPFTVNTKLVQLNQESNMGFQIAFNLGFSMAFVSSFYIMFYIRERVSKAKHLQFVSGAKVIPFWGAAFICDLLTFVFTSLLVITTLAAFQEDGFKTAQQLGRVFSVLLYFGFSMLPMMYLASYLFDIPSTGFTRMALLNIFTGAAAFIVVQVLEQPFLEQQNIAKKMHWIFLFVPHYSLSTGIRNLHALYSTHNICNIFLDTCITVNSTQAACRKLMCTEKEECCNTTTYYYDWQSPGIGANTAVSYSVGLFLMALLLIIEYGLPQTVFYKILQKRQSIGNNTEESQEDSDVSLEKTKIKNTTAAEINNYDLLIKNMSKYYKNLLAVNDLCLGVNKFECFGLLGINGAGKTTTFKILTGDIPISYGDTWVSGLNLKTEMKKIHQLIGYCPQFDALLDDLTCIETLTIFSLLRGNKRIDSKYIVDSLSRKFDFHQHLNKKVKELSGGNKRKLSTAVALVGDPHVLYLDEPTTGMDPATKRYLWNALCKIRDDGKCIILTSHSMEECEALCTRVAIMVNGVFKCIGSTQHLKSKFSDGYTLTIRMRKNENHSELQGGAELEPVEKFVKDNFNNAVTREHHQGLVTFYIADKTQSWSKMFGIMERGKKDLDIEDYSLGQCNLEQMGIKFMLGVINKDKEAF